MQAIFRFGKCPSPETTGQTFDREKWAGRWYEVIRDYQNPMEFLHGCVNWVFNSNGDGTYDVAWKGHTFLGGWGDIFGQWNVNFGTAI